MLHPSRLPAYRGGSPIQNQIIRGETLSAVSIFKIDDGLDTGDIFYQADLSLEGSLDEIFSRIVELGVSGTLQILRGTVFGIPQSSDVVETFKRLSPDNSEITLDELTTKPADYLYNKIRMLNDPYPNAFIRCCDGSILYLTAARAERCVR